MGGDARMIYRYSNHTDSVLPCPAYCANGLIPIGKRIWFKRAWASPALRKQSSEAHKRWFSEEGGGHLFRGRAVRACWLENPPEEEIIVQKELKRRKQKFEQQKMFLGSYVVDFFLPQENVVIECDGQLNKKKTEKRDAVLIEYGLRIFHVRYKDIRIDVKAAIGDVLKCI